MSFHKKYMFIAGISISSRYFLSDCFTQKIIQQKEIVDKKRIATFALFGFLYGGFPGYVIYSRFYPFLRWSIPKTVCVDLLIQHP